MRRCFRAALVALALLALVLIPTLHHHSLAPAASGDQLASGSAVCGLCLSGADHITLSHIASVSILVATLIIGAVAAPAPKEPGIETIPSRGPPLLLFA